MTSRAGGLYGGIQFSGKPTTAPSPPQPPPPAEPDVPLRRTQPQATTAPPESTAPAAKPSAGISSSVYHSTLELVN
jgi:hypothetical protein